MVFTNIVKNIIENGGKIRPLIIHDIPDGTGLCNGSILNHDGKLFVNVRHVEYSFFYCKRFQSKFEGILSYYHPDDDLTLRTNNYLGELDPVTLEISHISKVDTNLFDKKPLWDFIGLEDARIVNWDNKINLVGVRRDTTTNGQGRMEFSEVSDKCIEINRIRIEVPDKSSYCEKNWMPIMDKPYHFVKWANPTEVVEVSLIDKISKTIKIGARVDGLDFDLRGGSQIIRWDDNTYVGITHECDFRPKDLNDFKDAYYRHRFVVWDNDFNFKLITEPFNFMGAGVEFCCGLTQLDDDIYITFGFMDSSCYALKISKSYLDKFIWNTLKPAFKST